MNSNKIKGQRIFTLSLIFFLFLFSLPVIATYETSEDYNWQTSHYDSRKSGLAPTEIGFINEAADLSLQCQINSRDLTAQPLILNISTNKYVIIQTATAIEAYDDTCTNVADLSLNTHAPITSIYYNGWRVIVPLNNLTTQDYVFNGTAFSLNQSFDSTNITNSGGVCNYLSGVPYCYYQNLTNDLVRFTLSTGSVTEFTVMAAASNDTSRRYPAVSQLSSSGSEKVILTGKASVNTPKMCVWNTATEALDAGWNSGSCYQFPTSSQSNLHGISNPSIYNIDGGNGFEIGVVHTYSTAGTNIYGNLSVLDASGNIKYSIRDTLASGTGVTNRAVNFYNPVPLPLSTGTSSFSYFFCTVVELETDAGGSYEEIDVLCAGQHSQTNIDTSALDGCQLGNTATLCEWSCADVYTNNNEVNGSTSVDIKECIGEDKFLAFDGGPNDVTDFSVDYDSQYWALGDTNEDKVLDLVYEVGSSVYFQAGANLNNVPTWIATPRIDINSESLTLCVNQTYTVSTSTNSNYNDSDGDSVRLFIDCYGDGRDNNTGAYGVSGINQLQATCIFTNSGVYTVSSYLQDEFMAYTGTVSSTNLVEMIVTATDDSRVCSIPNSGTTSSEDEATGDTPAQDYNQIIAGLGLSSAWANFMWIIIMILVGLTVGYNLAVKGASSSTVLVIIGVLELFLLILGSIIGVIAPIFIFMLVLVILLIFILSIFKVGNGGG